MPDITLASEVIFNFLYYDRLVILSAMTIMFGILGDNVVDIDILVNCTKSSLGFPVCTSCQNSTLIL